MAISDVIAVMDRGVIAHIGKPQDIYQRPSNLFVATFIGKSNLLKAKLRREGKDCIVEFGNGYKVEMNNICADEQSERDVIVAARPEEILVNRENDGISGIRATVNDSVFLGLNTHYFVTLETGETAEIIQESQIDTIVPPGSTVTLTMNTLKMNLFDAQTEKSLMQGVQNSANGEV